MTANINDLKFARIAESAHEINRAYCAFQGDDSQSAWFDMPQSHRLTLTQGVKAILTGVTKSPEAQHQRWMAAKEADGWVWGPVKDAEKKFHPCLRPYVELPPEQRVKDTLFRAVVLESARLIGVDRA